MGGNGLPIRIKGVIAGTYKRAREGRYAELLHYIVT